MTNNVTGFPDVPEGYFWRVQSPRSGAFMGTYVMLGDPPRRIPRDTAKLEVVLIQNVEYSVTENVPFWVFFWRTETRMEVREEVQGRKTAKGTHPQALRDAANVVLKKWNRKREIDSLKGDYPPKKLP